MPVPGTKSSLAADGNGRAVQALMPIGATTIAYDSGVSYNFTGVDLFRLCSTTDCFVAFNNTVYSGSLYLPALMPEYFHMTGMTRLEVMKVSTLGRLNIVQMDY